MVSVTNAGNRQPGLQRTSSNVQESGSLAGWSIADAAATHNGTTWSNHASDSLRITVSGHVTNRLVANLAQSDATGLGLGEQHAQLFSTGGNSQGYRLTHLELDFTVSNPTGNQPSYKVSLYTAGSTNLPGSFLVDFVNPVGGSQGRGQHVHAARRRL